MPCTPTVFPESGSWMLARNTGDPTPSPATGLMATGRLVGRPFPLLAEGLELARDEEVHVLGGRRQAENEIQL